jgi:segregation and condensation protein B
MNKADIIEALLFAADRPLTVEQIAPIVEMAPEDVLEEIEVLREEKMRIGALQLREVAGGWQLLTKPQFASFVRQLREAPRHKLGRATLEALAIVAYRQPVTRSEVEGLRGVDCSRALTQLVEKKLLTLAGRRETPGRPWLYATTPKFLDHFGLRSLNDLPSLSEFAELSEIPADQVPQELFSKGAMQLALTEGENGETEEASD